MFNHEDTETVNQIIPANEGWFVAFGVVGDSDKYSELFYEPVIAWLVEIELDLYHSKEPSGVPTPITVGGPEPTAYLKRPDGSMWSWARYQYDSEDEVLKDMNRDRERRLSKL